MVPKLYMTQVDPLAMAHIDDWLHYNEEYDILICIPCGVVVMPGGGGGLKGHLEGSHNGRASNFALSTNARRELLQLYEHQVLNPDP
jgi:hypothetical protein